MSPRDDAAPGAQPGADTSCDDDTTSVTRGSDISAMTTTNITAGVMWIERGLPVFPIAISWDEAKGKTNKRPLTNNGFYDATTDRATFDQLVYDGMTRLKTGEVPACGLRPGAGGLVVFDDDNPPEVARLDNDLHLPPHTYRPRTGSGCEHRWLKKRDNAVHIGNSSPWEDLHVDIRSDAGYVVCPGTVTPWGEWVDGDEQRPWGTFATVPQAIWDQLAQKTSGGATGGKGGWKRYDPATHDEQLHPATIETLRWLTDPERGDNRVDVGTVTFRTRDEGEPYLEVTRPAKDAGVSGTIGFIGPGVLWVFSTNWPGLRSLTAYDLYDLMGAGSGDDEDAADGEAQGQAVRWRTPKPIIEGCDLPFPVDLLPEQMAQAVNEVAEAVMADPALPANAFLGAAAGLLGTITTVIIDGTWQTKCNAYFTVVAKTGDVKSPSMNPARTPLENVEAVMLADAEQDKITAEALLPIAQNNLKELQRSASADPAAVVRLQAQVREYQKTLRRDVCLMVDDVTPERLAELLADNGGRIVAWNDEGSLLSHLLGLYATNPNLDVWIKSWGGDDLNVGRKGGGGREKTSLRVPEPRMTIVSAVQPVTIRRIGRQKDLIDRGVPARALFSWPPSTAGTRKLQDRTRDAGLGYQHVGPWNLHLIENHRLGEMTLALSTDAHAEFAAWHDRIEEGLPAGGTYADVREFAVKYRECAARIAGLFARLEGYKTVQVDHMRRATALTDYYLANATVVVEAWAEDATALAVALLAKLRQGPALNSTTVRELYRDVVRARHREVLAALEILDHGGWVQPANKRTGYGSEGREVGKESPVVLLNPAIWEASDAS